MGRCGLVLCFILEAVGCKCEHKGLTDELSASTQVGAKLYGRDCFNFVVCERKVEVGVVVICLVRRGGV